MLALRAALPARLMKLPPAATTMASPAAVELTDAPEPMLTSPLDSRVTVLLAVTTSPTTKLPDSVVSDTGPPTESAPSVRSPLAWVMETPLSVLSMIPPVRWKF